MGLAVGHMGRWPVTVREIRTLLSCSVQYEHFLYPSYDTPLVEAYDRRFESVFVILHPFLRVPDELAWKTVQSYPSDEQTLAHAAKCPWSEVFSSTGLHTCAKLNQALLTSIRAIDEEVCDFAAEQKLQALLKSEPVWMPTEGRFEPLLQIDFLAAFETARKAELIFVPEFPEADSVKRFEVARLKSRAMQFPARGSLVPDDASFLITVDWDSFFTLFYGPRAFVAEVARRRNLEGFFASQTLEHFWFNYSMGCATVTISPEHWALAE